jgi:hypothetical protein
MPVPSRPYQSGPRGKGPSTRVILGLAAFLGVSACKREAPPKRTAPPAMAASASASVEAPGPVEPSPPAPRCREIQSSGLGLLLGGASAGGPGEEDDGVALPFSPEIGGGTAPEGGFALGALEPGSKATSAVLAVLSRALPAGRRIELGQVHGDVSAPRVAGSLRSLVVAVPDGAPSGTRVRLARVDDATGAPRITWGAEVFQGHDESDAFALEVGARLGILLWDEWDTRAGHGVVKAVTFHPEELSKTSAPAVISGDHEDAESPTLVRRSGGFWAAWVANARRAVDRKERPEPSDTAAPVEMGPRFVMLEPLDDAGKPTGAALAVTPKDGHVMGFDIAPARDGALVAWRDDATSPATAGGTVHVALVRPDGSIEPRAITDDEVGAAVPSLLVDAAPPGATHAWLALTNEADAARIGALDAEGRAEDALALEPSIGAATPLAIRGGEILIARARGRKLELQVVGCAAGARGAEPPGSP